MKFHWWPLTYPWTASLSPLLSTVPVVWAFSLQSQGIKLSNEMRIFSSVFKVDFFTDHKILINRPVKAFIVCFFFFFPRASRNKRPKIHNRNVIAKNVRPLDLQESVFTKVPICDCVFKRLFFEERDSLGPLIITYKVHVWVCVHPVKRATDKGAPSLLAFNDLGTILYRSCLHSFKWHWDKVGLFQRGEKKKLKYKWSLSIKKRGEEETECCC